MQIAEFKSPRDGSVLSFLKTSTSRDEVGFEVSVKTPHFSGSCSTSTFMNGSPASMFSEMAKEWQGWSDVKRWSDLEGSVKLEAQCDKLGHITIKVELRGQDYESMLRTVIEFEVAQLDSMAESVVDVLGK